MKLLIPLLIYTSSCFGQINANQSLLDSLNKIREKDRGAFNLYIKKPEVEIIVGAFRNRVSPRQNFEPFNFTYHIYLPFQFDLNYVNQKAKDKLLKINTTIILQHSNYGNYVFGLANRFSFLILKKTYISYQFGLVWCEPVKRNVNDGINDMGFCLHHLLSLNYTLYKHIKLSINATHLSSGNLFKNIKNNQDALGIGISYFF